MCTGFTGSEAVSRLFSFQLQCLSERPGQVKLNQLLGKNATLVILLPDGSKRFFNGIISRCAQTGRDAGRDARFTHYRLELVPWAWLLTRTTDSRIFQDKTLPDIIQQIFRDHGLQDFRNALTKTYTPVDYCVQYRETDWNFVCRLMEEEGIFYFFEHANGKHTLVLADSPDVHQPCPGNSRVTFEPEGGRQDREDTVGDWQEQQELRSGKVTLWDANFQLPDKNLESASPTKISAGGNDKLEIYDYPGGYAQRFNKPDERLGSVEPEGRTMVRTRMEEEEAQQLVITGMSNVRGFTAGTKFELRSPPPGVTGGPFVLTAVEHSASGGSFVSSQGGTSYTNSFTCIPQRSPLPPAPRHAAAGRSRARRRPWWSGRPGEEIYPDKYGRVKVQFFWDREGTTQREDLVLDPLRAEHRPARAGGPCSFPRSARKWSSATWKAIPTSR